jgi:hypothetical protein
LESHFFEKQWQRAFRGEYEDQDRKIFFSFTTAWEAKRGTLTALHALLDFLLGDVQ